MAKNSSGCRSCLLWLVCILAGMALIVAIAAYIGYRKFVNFRNQYTAAKPLVLPTVAYAQTNLDAVQKRIDQFLNRAQANQTNARLALSAADLNALVAASAFSNRVYVTLESNAVAGQFSVPLEQLGMLFRGRYLNGAGQLSVGLEGGGLSVKVKEISVNGAKLPDHYLYYIRQQNFAEGVGTNAVTQEAFGRVGRIAVEQGQLIFEARPK